LPAKEPQEKKIRENKERNDKRNDGDGSGYYRRGKETTVSMIWTHKYDGRDEMAKESSKMGTAGEV
jgi:hypothetical protein